MKQLIIGIDGGDKNLFLQLPMPFLHKIIKENSTALLKEDLMSRGWVEMISGQHGKDNNGFYLRPTLDGSHDFTLKYSFQDLKNNSENPMIWELVENMGFKAGIMNIPTTYPSPRVAGFFVSGAGGGLTKVDGIPKEMVSDTAILKTLDSNNYIIDLRFKPSGLVDLDRLFSELESMLLNRTQSFIELCKNREVDFGFLVFRAPVVLTYLAYFELEAIMKNKASTLWEKRLLNFFMVFDNCLKSLFEELTPKNFILTADHGIVGQKYHVNYNVFLEKHGYLEKETNLLQYLKHYVRNTRNTVKNNFGFNYLSGAFGKINWSRTKIFGNWYYNGLYVNDTTRFGGPVSENEIDSLIDSFIDQFNSSEEALAFNMKADAYRRNFRNSKFNEELPDIWIDVSDEYYHMGKGRKFVQKNSWYKRISTLKHIPSSMFTGTKGRTPLCIMNIEMAGLIEENDIRDLTLIYHLTQRNFSKP